MVTHVRVMAVTDLVELVNEWGTLPRVRNGLAPAEGESTVLADELHPIFAAGQAAADHAEQAARVTTLLQVTGVRPELSADLAEDWVVDDPTQARRASAALALRHHLAEHPGRLGVCADVQCADVYVDASPAGRRRFCCLTCQNRARAAAFRAREKQTRSMRAGRSDPAQRR